MSHPPQLTAWNNELQRRFPDLSASVVATLALYSFGVALSKTVGLSNVVLNLSKTLLYPLAALRKRLREFYLPAHAKSGVKSGVKRKDIDVSTCFAPLLRWILSLWQGGYLPLAIDVTNLGERFHVLCISVVVRGVGIPIAWKVLYGGMADPWNPHWAALLAALKTAVPDHWVVIVCSDRGLESTELFAAIRENGWHPLMRVKKAGKFKPTGWGKFYCFAEFAPRVGSSFQAAGRAYTGVKLACTLLARYSEGHSEPWLILTDLPPEAANAVWYAFRAWIEQGFKIIKGGGWQWDKTRMEDPDRVERVWLVMAVACLWAVAIGIADEVHQEQQDELAKQQRAFAESQEQAQQRQQREQHRQQKILEALQRRREAKEKREALKEQQRETKRRQQQAKKQQRDAQKQQSPSGAAETPIKAAATNQPSSKKAEAPRLRRKKEIGRERTIRVFTRGLAELHARWHRGEDCLPQHLHPENWPPPCHLASSLSEEDFLSQKTYP
jgi:hypothetical protein